MTPLRKLSPSAVCAGIARPDFEVEMEAEHCKRACSKEDFTTINYDITTTPYKEWQIVVIDQSPGPETDMRCVSGYAHGPADTMGRPVSHGCKH